MSANLNRRRMLVVLASSALASTAVYALRPETKLAEKWGKLDLELAIPKRFGDWQVVPQRASVVNPQSQTLVDKLYSDVLTRSYVNKVDGYEIMLSIAYGGDQRKELAVHLPEACYPAQGFRILDNQVDKIDLPEGRLAVRRLDTELNATRIEPVTYWAMVGEDQALGGLDQKILALKYTLRGQIPDGLLFRVSSIDQDKQGAFRRQAAFVAQLLAATQPEQRRRLAGL